MSEAGNVAAKIIRQVRVLQTENPKVGILKFENKTGNDHYVVSRQAMIDIGNHLIKAAERFEDDGEGPGIEHGAA